MGKEGKSRVRTDPILPLSLPSSSSPSPPLLIHTPKTLYHMCLIALSQSCVRRSPQTYIHSYIHIVHTFLGELGTLARQPGQPATEQPAGEWFEWSARQCFV